MALFMDGSISTMEDLVAQESTILDLASTEGIDLTRKLALAQEEVGIDLAVAMLRRGTIDRTAYSTVQAVLCSVTVSSPLRLWHTFHTLEMAFRDAYYNQLNDRYKEKWNEYKRLSRWAYDRLVELGVGMVGDPIARAEAPSVSLVPGNQPAATYCVTATWINKSGQEGSAAQIQAISAPVGNVLVISPVNAPANATAWNVYVGYSAETMALQNATPLGRQAAWVQPETGIVTGRGPGNGQAPNSTCLMPQVFQRG